jgi:lycopene beta-cyclase
MDARIQQIDGYRFFYLLPWSPTRLLVEDTYYSHHSGLKTERIEQEIMAYIQKQNWKVKSLIRKESGTLPLTLTLPSGTKQSRDEFPSIGAESGYFHPVTGYTAPTLLKQLCAICDHSNLTAAAMRRVLAKVEQNSTGRLRYYRFLNRMMFKGAEATERYKVLSHFYRMPEPVISRFYSGQTTVWDQLRILMGKPPVPVSKALRVLREKT